MEVLERAQSVTNEEELAGDLPIQISASKETLANEHSDDDEYVYANDHSKSRSRQQHDLEVSITRRGSLGYRHRDQPPDTKRKRMK